MYAIAPEHHLNALVLALNIGFKDPTPSVTDSDATLMPSSLRIVSLTAKPSALLCSKQSIPCRYLSARLFY